MYRGIHFFLYFALRDRPFDFRRRGGGGGGGGRGLFFFGGETVFFSSARKPCYFCFCRFKAMIFFSDKVKARFLKPYKSSSIVNTCMLNFSFTNNIISVFFTVKQSNN